MNLNFNMKFAEGYTSNSQIARVLTENWVKENNSNKKTIIKQIPLGIKFW
jgi:hypothetical protein